MKHLIWIICAVFCVSCTTVTGLKDIQGFSCPDTGFLRGLDRSAFTHDGVSYDVAMTGLNGSCRFPSETEVMLKTVFSVVAKSSDKTAAEGAKLRVPYTAVILDQDENVIQRREFFANIEVKANGYGLATEELEQSIPITSPEQSGKIKVIYGFPE